jgi:hypothetical protein
MKTRNKKKRVLSRTKHSLGVLAFEEPESAGTSKFIPFRCPLYLTNCVLPVSKKLFSLNPKSFVDRLRTGLRPGKKSLPEADSVKEMSQKKQRENAHFPETFSH